MYLRLLEGVSRLSVRIFPQLFEVMMTRSTVLVVAFVVGLVFVFFAGIGVGITVTTEAKPSEYVAEVIGSVGDWISGLGALAAAVIAINLADRQRQDSLPRIEIKQDVDPKEISIDIVSLGDRGALILGVFLRSRKLGSRARLVHSDETPKRLEYGELFKIVIGGHRYSNISNVLCGHDEQGEFPDLEIVVETSTQTFVVPADSDIIGVLEGTTSIYDRYYG
jgi:hypothetical protein